jgi:ribonuclease R
MPRIQKPQAEPTALSLSWEEINERILTALNESGNQPLTPKQILSRSGLKDVIDSNALQIQLNTLLKLDQIEKSDSNQYRRQYGGQQYIGTLELEPKLNLAQVSVPGMEEVVHLDPSRPLRAFNGDTVQVVTTRRKAERLFGEVIEVIQPARPFLVGTLTQEGHHMYFVAQTAKLKQEFLVQPDKLNGAKPHHKVKVKHIGWKGDRPIVEVLEVLGRVGEHQTEMHAIIAEFNLSESFPEAVDSEANAIPDAITEKDIEGRRDFRNILTFTIDPDDAKDFDDAISLRHLPDGNVEIGVHIADVTHYLRPNTLLDQEAQNRATSVYLVDRTIPMLPERLSNHLCSLVPHEDRLTFGAVFVFDAKLKLVDEWFGRTVIHSAHRFTYNEAQHGIETGEGPHAAELQELNRMALHLRKHRFANGSINFETQEVKFRLDEMGRPVELILKDRKDAHKLVEEFMLLANRQVGNFIANARKTPPIPAPYRIHDKPKEERLEDLSRFVQIFGYDLDIEDQENLPHNLNHLITDVSGTPEEGVVNQLTIRCMAKAVYSTRNIGHYGLAFENYIHFTSPIRRYPDVLIHRILQQVLDGRLPTDDRLMEQLCKHCSQREQRATDAERASVRYKQVEYLGARVGQQFDGVVSGIAKWGIYVELVGTYCEGLIPLRTMHDDHYVVDERGLFIKGRHTGRKIRFGETLRVEVVAVDLVKRTVDLRMLKGGKDTGNRKRDVPFGEDKPSRERPSRRGGKGRRR